MRTRILDAGKLIFLEKGLEGSSVEAIARRAAVSKVSVYAYFKDKRDVIRCALREGHFPVGSLLDLKDLDPSNPDHLRQLGLRVQSHCLDAERIRFERRIGEIVSMDRNLGEEIFRSQYSDIVRDIEKFLFASAKCGLMTFPSHLRCLVAEQFFNLVRGISDLELRFGAPRDKRQDSRRLEAAVKLFKKGYGKNTSWPKEGS